MKSKVLVILLLCSLSIDSLSQTKNKDILKGRWFFGAEFGLNTITSFDPNQLKPVQGGLISEYYYSNYTSLSIRVKYFETGVSDKASPLTRFFKGAVISVPINLNVEYPINKEVSGTMKIGLAANQELKSNYSRYFSKLDNISTFYGTFNVGTGFIYYLNNKTALYLNVEIFIFGNDRTENSGFNFVPRLPNSPNNNLLNLGIKHCFKK